MTTRVIQTARLQLEPIASKHAVEAWPHFDDAQMWTYFPNLRPKSLEYLRAAYARWENPYHAEGEFRENWACRNRGTGQLVGTMQATTLPARAISYIAYAVFAPYQRQGYAREAVAAVLQHLAEEVHVRRVFAEMAVGNEASSKLVESLGFTRLTKQPVAPELGVDGEEYTYQLTF